MIQKERLLREEKIDVKLEMEEMQRRHMPLCMENEDTNSRGMKGRSEQPMLGCGEEVEETKMKENLQNSNENNLRSQRQELFHSNPRLNQNSFEHIYKYFQDNDRLVQDLLVVSDKEFVSRCMKCPPGYTDSDYSKFSELLLKIINETVEFTFVRQKANQSDKNKRVSKKQISRNKLNRYIIILNRIEEKKVIKSLNLKKYIISLEKNQGVGEIDKKTLEHILNTFQYINYITLIKKDIHIKTIKQNIVRSIIVHKDTPLDDPKVIKAEKTIKKGLLKQGSQDEDDYSQTESESEMISSSLTQKKITEKAKESAPIKPNNGRQQDITNYLVKKKRTMSNHPEIYYYEEEAQEEEEEEEDTKQRRSVSKNEYLTPKIEENQALQEALSKVNKANCEVSARPEKMKILISLLLQYLQNQINRKLSEGFEKLKEKEDYSSKYSELYFQKDSVKFKYPDFQRSLCRDLLSLNQSCRYYSQNQIQLEPYSESSTLVPSVDQLLSEAFNSDVIQEEPSLHIQQGDIIEIEQNDSLHLENANNQHESDDDGLLKLVAARRNDISNLRTTLCEIRGKDIKNQEEVQQNNILKFKSYLLRNPCKRLGELKLRYQMVDYHSFLTQVAFSDSLKLFRLNADMPASFEKVTLNQVKADDLDSIYYQLTDNYYSHFNI